MLRMKKTKKEQVDSKFQKTTYQSNFMNNELISSKSLLANVLDINDEFGVIHSNRKKFLNNSNRGYLFNSKLLNEQLSIKYENYQSNPIYIKKETKNCENCENTNENIYSSYKLESSLIKKNLIIILKEMRFLTKKIKEDEEDEGKELDWKFAAMVIDRLCMWFFAIATTFSTVVILLTSKNFFELK